MRIAIGLLALTAACGNDSNDLPVGGGGNDGGFTFPDGTVTDTNVSDGASDGGTDSSVVPVDAGELKGRVCLATDPRKLNGCSDTLAGGLTVRIGTTSTTTAANGTFTIAYTGGTQWRVTGSNIVSSYMLLGDYEIPALLRSTYNQMNTDNLGNLPPNPGEGSVMIQVINDGDHVAGATAASDPTGAWLPFYDNPASATTFLRVATGPDGMMWLPAFDVGAVNIAVDYNGQTVNFTALPVFDGGITFATAIFPTP